jgi:hypothetical protein
MLKMKIRLLSSLIALYSLVGIPSSAASFRTYSIPVDKPMKLKPLLSQEVVIKPSQIIESRMIDDYVVSSVDMDGNKKTIEAIFYSSLVKDDKSAFLDNDNDGRIDVVAHRQDGRFHYHPKENIRTFAEAFSFAKLDGVKIVFKDELYVPRHQPENKMPLADEPILYSSRDLNDGAASNVDSYLVYFIGNQPNPFGVHAESVDGKSIVVYYDTDKDQLADFMARSDDSGSTFIFEFPYFDDDLRDIKSIYSKYKKVFSAAN